MLGPTSVKHIERTLKHEGGYVNHPRDPGGETNLGVTWPALKAAQTQGIVPKERTIRTLTHSDAVAIFYENYYKQWEWIESDALRFQVFDASVHHGASRAAGWLQRILGVPSDGDIGPVTKAAYANATGYTDTHEFVLLFLAIRLDFLNDLGIWPTFGKGFAQRIVDNLNYAAEDL